MKKYLISIFIFILMFTFIGSVSAKENVEITNVSISDKTDIMVAKVDSFNGLTLNTKESFYEVGDFVTYNITIKNTTGKSLSVAKISDNLNNEYISSEYNYDKKEIKNNSEYSFNVTLKYKKEITDNSMNFNVPLNIVIEYIDGSSTGILVNPDTKDNALVYFIIFVLSAISLVLFKTRKKKLLVFVIALGLIPSIVNAASNKITITMNNEIGIYKRLAIMDTGANVNRILKELAGTDTSTNENSYSVIDENIKHVVRARELPSNVNKKVISSSGALIPVYAWYDNGTIYYYSESDKIYLNKDSARLFANLTKVEDIDLSSFDTSNATTMRSMFYGCSSLTNLDVTHFDTSNVRSLKAMFYICTGLKSIDVSNFDTSNVTDMSGMFSGGHNVIMNFEEIVGLDKFDTSKVTNMSNMFKACSKMKTIDVSNFDTSNVTDMSGMFHDCTNLESLDVSHFNTSKVTKINHMFNICDGVGDSGRAHVSSLTYLDLSNFDFTNVDDMQFFLESMANVNTEFTIRKIKVSKNEERTGYISALAGAAVYPDRTRIVINYSSETEELVDDLIATGTGNIVKGRLVD